MFTCQVHVLYTRAEEEEEEVQIYFLSTKNDSKNKKESYMTLYCLLCNTPHTIMNKTIR